MYDRGLTELLQREHGRVFKNIRGEDVELCLPGVRIPEAGLDDYTACS